jgi:two-component system, cell cycle sensor histidine kinase and response regulator CckA
VYVSLLQNAAILVALSTLYGLLARFRRGETAVRIRLLTGLLFGAVAIAGMLLPYRYQPGLIYDGRSIVLSMAGLFGGGDGTAVAILVAGIYRALKGGVGVWAGLATIVFCPLVGLAFRRLYHNRPEAISAVSLYGLGIAAHVVMLACQMLVPWATFVNVIRGIWLPVLLIFPVATLLIGLLLRTEERRVQATHALVESNRRLNELATQLNAVVWTASVDGKRIQDVSPVVETVSGLSPENLKADATLWLTRVHPDDRPGVEESLERVSDRGQVHMQYRIVHGDDAVRWVNDHRSMIYDETGAPVGMGGIITDITESKTMQEEHRSLQAQMLQAQKMEAVGRLAGGVAHDFNNLLTVMNNYASMAISDLGPASCVQGYLKEILAAGERAAGLTRQLLAFSRRQIMEPEILDLGSVVSDMKKMLARLIGEDIRLETIQAEGLWPVRADPAQVQQVIMNLAVNARDAMPQGGALTIETANAVAVSTPGEPADVDPGDYVVLRVTDTGCGMETETLLRMFEPFFTTKEEGRGTGLGLSTVYGIVKQSGGYIFAESRPGETVFTVYFPRAEGKAGGPGEAEEAGAQSGTETVLLVEDDQAVRELTERMLASAGYRIIAAGSGEEALALSEVTQERIDLVVSDVVMPIMSGRELADRLKKTRPELRVLFMSGYTDETVTEQGVLARDDDFISKPFGREQLLRAVRGALDPA